MDQSFPCVGGPWASSVLGDEERKGRREEGKEERPDTLVLKLGWGWKSPEI